MQNYRNYSLTKCKKLFIFGFGNSLLPKADNLELWSNFDSKGRPLLVVTRNSLRSYFFPPSFSNWESEP